MLYGCMVCIVCTCLHMFAHVCTCLHMFAHVCTCLHMFAHVCTCLHMFANLHQRGEHMWTCATCTSVATCSDISCQESSPRVIPLRRHGSRPSQWSTKLTAVARLQSLGTPSLEIPIRTQRWRICSLPHEQPDTGSTAATKSRLRSRLWGIPVHAFHPVILAAKANRCTDLRGSCSSQSCDDCVQLNQ